MAVKPSLRKKDWKGRQKQFCGYPPSDARSQKAETGISGKEDNTKDIDILENPQNLKYFNEYGAFSEDGKEYF